MLQCVGFSLRWLLLVRNTGSRLEGFSSCSTWAQQLWCQGLVALQHVESSWTRDQTCVPCIGRRIPIHCTTGEVLMIFIASIDALGLRNTFIFSRDCFFSYLPQTCTCLVQLLSRVRFFVTPCTAACQTSLSITSSQSLLKLMSIESVMPSNHLVLCRPLLFLPSISCCFQPSIRVFSHTLLLLLLLTRFSCVRLCATPWTAYTCTPANQFLP